MTTPAYQPNPRSEFRVKFDFRVEFTNGGFVEGRDFLLDLKGPQVSDVAPDERDTLWRKIVDFDPS